MPETAHKPSAAVRPLNHGVTTLPSEGSFKQFLTRILENRWFDLLILLFILCDLAFVVVELGIDHHIVCIGGIKVNMSPNEVAEQVALPLAGTPEAEEEIEEEATEAEEVSLLGTPRKEEVNLLHATQTPKASNASPRSPREETMHRRPHAVIIGTDSQQTVINPGLWSLRRPQRSALSSLQITHAHSKTSKSKAQALLHRFPSMQSLREEEEEEEAWVCEGREGPTSEMLSSVCHYGSVAILVFFLLEQIMKIYVAGKHYFDNPFHILDFVVITVSLVLDAFITPMLESHGWDNSPEDILMILLILLRCWRVVRIAHGLHEVMDKQTEALEERIHELEEELAKRQ